MGARCLALDTFANNKMNIGVGRSMLLRQQKPRSFGADDRPLCVKCGNTTALIRRSPMADDFRYEQQTFLCRVCDERPVRVVDINGNPPD
jgi:hypothetical protein